jgi:hypothetical protein
VQSLPVDFVVRVLAGDSAVFGPDDLFLGWRSELQHAESDDPVRG